MNAEPFLLRWQEKFELVGSVVEELARTENAKSAQSHLYCSPTYRDNLALIVS